MTLTSLPTALRFRLLKHTRLNVVAFLNELPKTQHDVSSFVVDISAQTVSTDSPERRGPPARPLPPSRSILFIVFVCF